MLINDPCFEIAASINQRESEELRSMLEWAVSNNATDAIPTIMETNKKVFDDLRGEFRKRGINV